MHCNSDNSLVHSLKSARPWFENHTRIFKFSLPTKQRMGVNLVGSLDGFKITRENFKRVKDGNFGSDGTDGSVNLGCVDEGNHRVLRFSLITKNIGDKDLIIGDPRDRPDIFEASDVYDTKYQFRTHFFVYNLRNDDSSVNIHGYKIPYCFDALEKMDCFNQGILAGGAKEDTYEFSMPCQFVVIDDVPDGEYILEATVNAPSVDAVKSGKGTVIIEEDNYDDNTVGVRLQIKGDNINVIEPK
jgi:hypothetical protein